MNITFTTSGGFHIEKAGPDERIITAVAMIPNVPDGELDVVSESELEKAAALYLKDSRAIWLDHRTPLGEDVELMESFIAPERFTIGGVGIPRGSWIVKMKVLSEKIWGLIKGKVLRSLSVGGHAQADEVGGKRYLRDLEIREISLCENGVVPAAKILAMKSDAQSLVEYIESPAGLAQLQQIAAVVADLKANRTNDDAVARRARTREAWEWEHNYGEKMNALELRARARNEDLYDRVRNTPKSPFPSDLFK